MELPLELASKWSRFCNWYNYLTLHVVPEPRSLSFFTLILLLPTALLIPPTVLSHRQLSLLFLPIFLAYGVQTWRADGVLDVITTTGLQWSFVLLACYDPRKDFKRVWWEEVEPGKDPVQEQDRKMVVIEQAYPEMFVERIPWVLTLLVSIRLAGWRIGYPSHDQTQPKNQSLTRIAFLKHAVTTSAFNYMLLDLSACYARTDPYFATSGIDVDAPFPLVNPRSGLGGLLLDLLRYLPPRLVRSSTLAAQIHGLIAGGFYPLTIPVIGLNAMGFIADDWSPHTWPMFFGPFSVVLAKGLRGMWGSWWHQMNRQIHATPGRTWVSITGLDKQSYLGRMIVVVVAFVCSGWMHMGMIPPEPLSTRVTPHEMRMTVAAFFWAQPFGIAIESAAATFLGWAAPHVKSWPGAWLMTLIWVSTWLCLTLPWLTVPFRELGYWTVYPIPFSVLHGLAGDRWWTWPS